MSKPKANLWRTQEPLTAPPRRGVRLKASTMMVGPAQGDAEHSPAIATNIAEARFGNRADKAIRKFSWEDGE